MYPRCAASAFASLCPKLEKERGEAQSGKNDDRVYKLTAVNRLCALFQIINLLVLFEPADQCVAEGEVLLAPLPAQKLLWEARDEHAWQRDGVMEPAHIKFGLTRRGQLVKLGGGGGEGAVDTKVSSSTVGRHDTTATAAMVATTTMTMAPGPSSGPVVVVVAAQATGASTVLKWNEWCSGMDGIGNLVMLAASLIQSF